MERSVKILMATTIGFVVYGIALIYLGIKEDNQDYDQIVYTIQGLIISPVLIVAYATIIKRMRHYQNTLLQKY